MQESRRQFLAVLTTGVTGALAGCGGSEDSTATPATGTETAATTETETAATTETETVVTETETAATTETETAAATETETTATEVETDTGPAQTVSVAAEGFSFSPESFEIAVGDTVRWEWEAGGHNVRPDAIPGGSDWSGTEGGDSDTYSSGHTYSYTFEVAGEYSYYCGPHQSAGMVGSFTVTE
jgi:plastocyanin